MTDGNWIIEKIHSALGTNDDDKIVIKTPQFKRQDGIDPDHPPLTHEAMDELAQMEQSELEEMGLLKWSDETGVWLLPHEWHSHIPRDYPLVDIFDEETTRGEMPAEPDKRLGVLSAGIVPAFERGEK